MWKARRHFRVFFGRHQRRVDRGAPLIQETIERISARTDTPQNDLVESRFTETTTCPGNNEDNDDEAAVVPERSAQATTRLVAADVRLHRRPPVIAGGLCQATRPRSVMSRRCRSRCVGSVPAGGRSVATGTPGGTTAGAGLGAIFGGKKGALIGAALGGGAGTLYEVKKR